MLLGSHTALIRWKLAYYMVFYFTSKCLNITALAAKSEMFIRPSLHTVSTSIAI